MTDLANARETDPNKFHIGLGQDQMAIIPETQDIVTLGASLPKFLQMRTKRTSTW